MKSKDSRETHHWTRAAAMMRPSRNAPRKPVTLEAQRMLRTAQPGPYESSYEVSSGYGFDRRIETP